MGDNNTESDKRAPFETEQVYINIFYILVGSCTTAGNAVILLTIALTNALRQKKEMIIMSGMAFADVLTGFGFLYSGGRRLYLVLTGQLRVYVTRWSCMLEPATFFLLTGYQMSSLMNLFIAVDRFMAVAFLNIYTSLTVRCGHYMVGFASTYTMASFITGFIISYNLPRNASVFKQCLGTWASNPTYAQFWTTFVIVCATSSVCIYIVVMIVLKWQTSNSSVHVHDLYRERQIQVTKTLAIVSLMTLLLFVIPWITNLTLQTLVDMGKIDKIVPGFLGPFFWFLTQLNNAMNVFIYMLKFKDMRMACLKLFRLKHKVGPTDSHAMVQRNTAGATLQVHAPASNMVDTAAATLATA